MNTPPKPNLRAHANAWLDHLWDRQLSPSTIALHAEVLRNLIRHLRRTRGIHSAAECQAGHLHAWIKSLTKAGCALSTIDLYTRFAMMWFRWLAATDRIFLDPASGLTRPKFYRPLGRCPSEKQVATLLNSIEPTDAVRLRDRVLLELAYATGARCEEIVRLDERSVDFEKRSVRFSGKGGKERLVPLTRSVTALLADYLKRSRPALLGDTPGQPALFLGTRGARRLAKHALARVIVRRARTIGMCASPHDFRRAFATHLLERGASIAVLKRLLGHAGYRHLRRYLQPTATTLRASHLQSPLNQ